MIRQDWGNCKNTKKSQNEKSGASSNRPALPYKHEAQASGSIAPLPSLTLLDVALSGNSQTSELKYKHEAQASVSIASLPSLASLKVAHFGIEGKI